jgi:2-oxoisovalerate dehydrogenase E1 component
MLSRAWHARRQTRYTSRMSTKVKAGAEPDWSFSAETLDAAFTQMLRDFKPQSGSDAGEVLAERLSAQQTLDLFDAQLRSRHLDFAGLWMREQGKGFYTIGSSGHEGNVAVAEALLPTDPALLHYRSGAFFLHRARQLAYPHAVRDVLLGMAASKEEPIAGGRHKVFGNLELNIPPQTSTIGSHLPKAVGMAYHLKRALRLELSRSLGPNAIVMCSFGDASANHSTATGAINAACYIAHQDLTLPVLFVCEDNGLGISVRTAPGWIAQNFRNKPGLKYFAADGCILPDALDAARDAVNYVRTQRKPAFLHLSVVRLFGHAGSDVALAYRTVDEMKADLARDPVITTAKLLVEACVLTREEVIDRYETVRREVRALAEQAIDRPRLETAEEVMAPIAPLTPERIEAEVTRPVAPDARHAFWGPKLPEETGLLTLAGHINRALGDMLVKYPELLVFGEDVARKGGVYGVTRGLLKRAGVGRVYDTLLDEQTILGLAIGAAQTGFIPVPEIQYLAYLHTAEDQLRGEAATLQFFSQAQFRNPMVVRIAAYAYQAGFGGHFHNDNSVAVFRDVPGMLVATPSNGQDAASMLRTCVAAARVDGAITAFLEPIALYNTRDLYEKGDDAFMDPYDSHGPVVPIGRGRTYGDGTDLTIITFGNGVRMSRRVARRLEEQDGVKSRVFDLRWIAPMPIEDMAREANATGRVLVVDETRRSGGVSEGIVTALVDAEYTGKLKRVAAQDSFIPLGPAANLVLVSEADILTAARELLGR